LKYALELIDLMGAYPGRGFKMREIVRYVAPHAIGKERHTIRRGVLRVVDELVASGTIDRYPPHAVRGESTLYTWKVRQEKLDSATNSATIEPEKLRPHETCV
jgi:hypothetical protein